MTTDQDLSMNGQSAVAVFAANAIDVTSSKDKGVLKVFVVFCMIYTILLVSIICDSIYYLLYTHTHRHTIVSVKKGMKGNVGVYCCRY